MSTPNNRPRFRAVVNGGTPEKPHWVRIGAAFETANGGLSIKLHAVPTDGRIWLFDPTPKADEA